MANLNIRTDPPRLPPTPPRRTQSSGGWIGRGALIIGIGFVLLSMLSQCATEPAPSRPTSRVGMVGFLGKEGDMPTRVILAKDKASFNKYIDAAALSGASDDEFDAYAKVRDAMIEDGRLFSVPHRSRVKIVAERGSQYEVEILEGKQAGRTGLVALPWVRAE